MRNLADVTCSVCYHQCTPISLSLRSFEMETIHSGWTAILMGEVSDLCESLDLISYAFLFNGNTGSYNVTFFRLTRSLPPSSHDSEVEISPRREYMRYQQSQIFQYCGAVRWKKL